MGRGITKDGQKRNREEMRDRVESIRSMSGHERMVMFAKNSSKEHHYQGNESIGEKEVRGERIMRKMRMK